MATNTIIGINRHYAAIVGCATAFTAGATVTLAMRVISKTLTRTPFAWEDYTIFLGTAIYIVTEGLMIKGVTVGRRSTQLNDPEDMYLTRMVYIYSIFYFAVIALCIASILLLYRRIFVKPFVKHTTTVLLVITVCWWIPCTIIEAGYFGALPETFPGDPENTTPFRISYLNWWFTVGLIEQIIIIIAILLPIREIYRLQLQWQKQLAMMLVFAVSYTCVGTGIARLACIYHPNQKNLDISLGDIWVSTHLGTAIMSTNLPVCWPVFLRAKRFLSTGRSHQQSHTPDLEELKNNASGSDSVLEAATVGPTTKDGHTRNEMMAREMGSETLQGSPLSSQSSGPGARQAASPNRQSRVAAKHGRQARTKGRSRWLELRSFDWRMSTSGSMFSSQNSSKG